MSKARKAGVLIAWFVSIVCFSVFAHDWPLVKFFPAMVAIGFVWAWVGEKVGFYR